MSVTKRNRVGTLEYGPALACWEIQDHEHLRGIKFEQRVVSFMHLFLESSFYSYFLPHRICSGIFFIRKYINSHHAYQAVFMNKRGTMPSIDLTVVRYFYTVSKQIDQDTRI